MKITGSSPYEHRLWDYDSQDHVVAVYYDCKVMYSMEKVRVDDYFSIVMLIPRSITPRDGAPIGMSLNYRKVVRKGFNMQGQAISSAVMSFVDDEGHKLAMSPLSPVDPIVLPTAVYYNIVQQYKYKTETGKTIAPVTFVPLLRTTITDDRQAATAADIIFQTLIVSDNPVPLSLVAPLQRTGRNPNYWRVPGPMEEKRESPGFAGREICPSLRGPAFVPARSAANERWSIEERVIAQANPMTALPTEFELYAADFINQFATPAEVITPEDVATLQSKPSQVARNKEALPTLHYWLVKMEVVVKSFLKMEAYDSLKDPRNISTLPSEHQLSYSCFTIPAAKRLAENDWYAFSRTPEEVEQRVHFLANKHKNVVETDFSRFDGTHSQALYNFELMFLKRMFRPSHHRILDRLHRACHDPKARTASGIPYRTHGSRLSGCSDTSFANTLDNAFVAYCAYRRSGLSHKDAVNQLGFYGGDDGLSYDIDPVIYMRVAKDLGLKLKVKAKPTHLPVGMLGRIHLNPAAMPGSIADPVRSITKLHISVDDQVSDDQAAVNKAQGLIITDSKTPILGAWATKVLSLYPNLVPQADKLAYAAQFGPCVLKEELHDLAYSYVAEQLHVDPEDVRQVERDIASAQSLDDFPRDPFPYDDQPLPPGTQNADGAAPILHRTDPPLPARLNSTTSPCPATIANAVLPNLPPAPASHKRARRRRSATVSAPTAQPMPALPALQASTSKPRPTRKVFTKIPAASTVCSQSVQAGGPVSPASTTSTASTQPGSVSAQLLAHLQKATSQCASTVTPSSTTGGRSKTYRPVTKPSPVASPDPASSPSTATSSTASKVGTQPALTSTSLPQPAQASSISKQVVATLDPLAVETELSAKSPSSSTLKSQSPPPSPRTPPALPFARVRPAPSLTSSPKTSTVPSQLPPRQKPTKASGSNSLVSRASRRSSTSARRSEITQNSLLTGAASISSTSGSDPQSPSSLPAERTSGSSIIPAVSKPASSSPYATQRTKRWTPRPKACEHGHLDCPDCHHL